jgi:hypothetical protein
VALIKIDTTLELINNFKGNVAVGTLVETLGYASVGDGGGAQWKRTGNLLTASQSPAQLGDALLNDKGGNQWALVVKGMVNAKSLGAIGDDTADDTLPLIAWLATGSAHYLPAGTYKTTSSITKSGQLYSIDGEGIQTSIIKSYGNYDTLILDNAGGSISRIKVSNIGIFANAGDKTVGASIRATGPLTASSFTDIYIRHYHSAFVLEGCAKFYMTNISYDQFGRDAGTRGLNAFNCLSTTSPMVDWHLTNVQGSGFEAGGGHNIDEHFSLRRFDGIYLSDSHFFYGDVCVEVTPVDGEVAASFLCSNSYFDTIRVAHFRVNTSTGSTLKSYGFEGCTFRACEEGSAIQLLNTDLMDGFRVQGGTIRGNFGSGIRHSTAGDTVTGLIVSGVTFQDNNSENNALGGDVIVRADASVINSNTFSGGGAAGNCVRFLSSGDNNIATGNNMSATTCAVEILDGGTGNIITGNLI